MLDQKSSALFWHVPSLAVLFLSLVPTVAFTSNVALTAASLSPEYLLFHCSIFIAYSHVTANNGVDNTLRSDVLPTTFGIALILLIPIAFLAGAYV
jgi:uncharacterized membrane protein